TASRRWYWPAAAAMNLRRFGPSARIPIRWRDPSLAGLRRSTAPVAAPVEYGASQPVADHFMIRGRLFKLPRYTRGLRHLYLARISQRRQRPRGASLELNRVMIVMQTREVLEVYHAHPPVGRFPFRRLVGVYGSGACQDQDGRHAEGIRRLNRTRLSAF